MADPFVLLLEWFTNPDHAPLFAGLDQGFYRDEGVELSILIPSDPDDALKLVAADRVDVALNYQPNLILARAASKPVVSVGLLVQHTLDTIMVRKGTGVNGLADLRGKRIGVAVESFDQIMFRAAARHEGLSGDEFEYVDVGFDFTGALLSGRADAVMGAFKNYERIEAELAGTEVQIFELEDFGVPDFYQLIFIASERAVTERDELLAAFVRASDRALQFTLNEPALALEGYFRRNPSLENELNRRAFEATLPYYARTQLQAADRWDRFQDFMDSLGLLERKTRVSDMFTNRFVPAEP